LQDLTPQFVFVFVTPLFVFVTPLFVFVTPLFVFVFVFV